MQTGFGSSSDPGHRVTAIDSSTTACAAHDSFTMEYAVDYLTTYPAPGRSFTYAIYVDVAQQLAHIQFNVGHIQGVGSTEKKDI